MIGPPPTGEHEAAKISASADIILEEMESNLGGKGVVQTIVFYSGLEPLVVGNVLRRVILNSWPELQKDRESFSRFVEAVTPIFVSGLYLGATMHGRK